MALFLGLIISSLALVNIRDTLNRLTFHYLLFFIRNNRVATIVFALLFFPGVALHELSHFIAAKLLFVKTHRFSLIPEWVSDGTVRFGFVEMGKTDKVRGALIGLAPMVSGILFIRWIGLEHLHLERVIDGIRELELSIVIDGMKAYFSTQDMVIWSYLLVAVSNSMLPSKSDKRAWFPAVMVFILIYIVVLIISMGSPTSMWMVAFAADLASSLISAFSVAIMINLLFVIPLWLLDLVIRQVSG